MKKLGCILFYGWLITVWTPICGQTPMGEINSWYFHWTVAHCQHVIYLDQVYSSPDDLIYGSVPNLDILTSSFQEAMLEFNFVSASEHLSQLLGSVGYKKALATCFPDDPISAERFTMDLQKVDINGKILAGAVSTVSMGASVKILHWVHQVAKTLSLKLYYGVIGLEAAQVGWLGLELFQSNQADQQQRQWTEKVGQDNNSSMAEAEQQLVENSCDQRCKEKMGQAFLDDMESNQRHIDAFIANQWCALVVCEDAANF